MFPKEPQEKKAVLKRIQDVRDEPCYLRFPGGICDSATVVFAHYRAVSLGAGVARKGVWGCPACHRCHDIADGRASTFERDFVRRVHAEQTLRYAEKLRCKGFLQFS